MAGKRPDFNLLVPIEREDKNGEVHTNWVRFGAAWKNSMGNLSCTVDFWPVGSGNRIVLMPPKSQDGDGDQYDPEEIGS